MAMQTYASGGMIAHFIQQARKCVPPLLSSLSLMRVRRHHQHSYSQGEHLQGKALQDFVIDKIDDLKGQDIVAIDVHGKSSITDCMIICTGTSSRHVMSIADHVMSESRHAGLMPLGIEGQSAADWIVVDLGDVIVHVMQEESRRLYELEKLWS